MANKKKMVGVMVPHWEYGLGGDTPRGSDVLDFAKNAESLGMDSIWVVDHLVMDQGEYASFVGIEPIPEGWAGAKVGMWECWSIASALSVATTRVKIGTLVSCTGFRNPALLARIADTVDELSGGRLTVGLGAGYHKSEYDAFGFPFDHRIGRFEEALQIIKPLLRGSQVTFDGDFYRANGAQLHPKGPTENGPPLLIGASKGSPRMHRLVAQYADEWNCWMVEQTSVKKYQDLYNGIIGACEKTWA